MARSAGIVGIAVMASRLLGLVREQVFAGLFGAGHAYDAFVVAYRIPNLLRDLFAEGALSAAFVTVFTDFKTRLGRELTWRLARNVMTAVVLIVGAICLAGMVFSRDIVMLLTAENYHRIPGQLDLTTLMTVIMFPFLLMVALSAVSMGMLNTMGRFFVPSMASCFFNLGSIVAGVTLTLSAPYFGYTPIVGMAWGVIAGGILQVAIQIPSLRREGFHYRPLLDFSDPGLRRILLLMLPAVLGFAAPQINNFINTWFASGCETGSLSWLQYAYRVLWFPIGLVGSSLAIAAMPVMSRHAATGDRDSLRRAYTSATVMSFILSIPAMCGLIFLSQPIIQVLFERGQFGALDTHRTALALSIYALSLTAFSALKIAIPIFYALNKTRYPVIGAFLTVGLNLIIIFTFIDRLQYCAIALSFALFTTFNFLFLAAILYRCLQGFPVGYMLVCVLKIVPVSIAMGALCWWLNTALRALLSGMPFAFGWALLVSILCGTLFYAVCISAMRIPEFDEIRSKILTRIKR
jgi:putative peptidoglycan lipid II flippase